MTSRRKALYILPSLLTVASIFCGFLAVILAVNAADAGAFYRAALLIGLAMVFDGFDGRVARMTRTQSDFGVQLDSLADVVSFGVAPAVIVYQYALHDLGFFGAFAAFAYIACGAIRLARFNVQAAEDKGASTHFVGLPIPAAAGVVASAILMLASLGYAQAPEMLAIPVAIGMMSVAALMVSTVRYKTFKKIRTNPSEKLMVGAIVVLFAFMTVRWGFALALASSLAVYIGIGLLGAAVGVGRKVKAARTNAMTIDFDLDE